MKHVLTCSLLNPTIKKVQMGLAILTGLLGGYILVNLVNIMLDMALFMKHWFVPVGILFSVVVTVHIMVYFITRGKLSIYRSDNGEHTIRISFPSGNEQTFTGTISCTGHYTRTYARYGTYYKNLALSVRCNGIPVCLLRHQLGGLISPPEHFIEMNELYNPGGPEYWCRKTVWISNIFTKITPQTLNE